METAEEIAYVNAPTDNYMIRMLFICCITTGYAGQSVWVPKRVQSVMLGIETMLPTDRRY